MPLPATITYRDLRASMQQEKDRRKAEHQAAVAARRRMTTAALAAGPNTLNLVAQGDSWFDYPLPFPTHSDVVAHLTQLPSMAPLVYSLAMHGEAAEDMLGVKKLDELRDALNDPGHGHFDAILFSGGGNDLAGNQFRLWLNDAGVAGPAPATGLNAARVQAILAIVSAAFEDLIQARDRIDKSIPIFAHSYDFAIPSNVGVCNTGPWLWPSFADRGWTDHAAARAVVKVLLEEFAALLDALASSKSNFIHVRTQGTLADAQWANELHPNPDGFAAITAKFVAALRTAFPARI